MKMFDETFLKQKLMEPRRLTFLFFKINLFSLGISLFAALVYFCLPYFKATVTVLFML